MTADKLPAMPDAEAQLDAFISRFSPDIAGTGRAAIARLRERFPHANVLVYDNYNALAAGFAPGESSRDAILSIAFYPRWVSLFFLQAMRGLEDPNGLLKGSGKLARHIVLSRVEDLDTPAISLMIDQAIVKAKTPLDPSHHGQVIIKSVSEKQRARRPETGA